MRAAMQVLVATTNASARSAARSGSNRSVRRLLHNKSRVDKPVQCKNMHSSAAVPIASMEYSHLHETGLDVAQTSSAVQGSLTQPTSTQLRTLFVSSAIPMIGFGFMDNFIMIQAGGYIDATIGVKFGLATMTAAAMGQVVSDVSGVICGGALERTLVKAGVIKSSNLTNAQRQLPLARNVAMFGGVLGVMLGCCLGATSLYFMDLESCERHKRAAELQQILTEMLKLESSGDTVGSELCTLYLVGGHHTVVESDDASGPRVTSIETAATDSYARKCARTGVFLIDNNADEGVVPHKKQIHSVLCAPVFDKDGQVSAVVEFCNKKGQMSDRGLFTDSDERLAKMLAHHVGIFIEKIAD
uniref:GAF domain-containing protein n=1 Tax=Pseudictyota dubia TaxID=2749911 RepID=A0A7R9W1B4_9STRA